MSEEGERKRLLRIFSEESEITFELSEDKYLNQLLIFAVAVMKRG